MLEHLQDERFRSIVRSFLEQARECQSDATKEVPRSVILPKMCLGWIRLTELRNVFPRGDQQ